jgi:hypothetical protein
LLEDEDIDPSTHRITCGYDKRRDGIVIAITLIADGSNSNYFYAIRADGFFPETYPDECGAYSMLYYPSNSSANSDLLIGSRDGYIRNFSDLARDDDIGVADAAINSECLMPIIDMNEDDDNGRGRTLSTTVTTAGGRINGEFKDTDGLTMDIHVADESETLVEDVIDGATPRHTKTTSGPGRQLRFRGKARGKWLGVLLKNSTASEWWALGKLSVESKVAGRIKGA